MDVYPEKTNAAAPKTNFAGLDTWDGPENSTMILNESRRRKNAGRLPSVQC
jgi:hypothetical protein